jgi:protein KRI1
MATDAELNQYMGVKRYAPYRKEARWDSTRVERLKGLKSKLAERSGEMAQDADGAKKQKGGRHQKSRKGKKERQMLKAAESEAFPVALGDDVLRQGGDVEKDEQKKRKSGYEEGAGEPEGGRKRKRKRRHGHDLV